MSSTFLNKFFKRHEKVAVFIDGANLYSAMKGLEKSINFRTLYEEFNENTDLLRIIYYTALRPKEVTSPLRRITDWMHYNNFSLVTKETREFVDNETGIRKIKANMDIEIALDMIQLAPFVDHIVLFSGDGDFVRLVDTVQRQGRKVSVISTIETQPSLTADILRRQADQFIELNEWNSIAYEKKGQSDESGGDEQ